MPSWNESDANIAKKVRGLSGQRVWILHALALSQPCMLLQGASLQCQWLAADSPARPLAHCLQASFLRNLPPIDQETADALDFEYQTRAETLLAVDDMIEAVIHVCV